MKKTNIKTAVIAVIAIFLMSSCTYVRQGEVALKVYELGEKKGQIEVLGPGRYAKHWFGYFSYKHFPTTLQQWSWTANEEKGSRGNEEITYQAEGEKVSADVGIEFEFPKSNEEIIAFYKKYRKTPRTLPASRSPCLRGRDRKGTPPPPSAHRRTGPRQRAPQREKCPKEGEICRSASIPV